MAKYYHENESPLGNIYLPDGWLNMEKLYFTRQHKVIIVMGRGTGKTYGMFDTIYKHQIPTVYLRRTQDQLEVCLEPTLSPIYDYTSQSGNIMVTAKVSKNTGGFWTDYVADDEGNLKPCGEPLGLIAGLSTAYKVRSMSGLRYKLLFFDEFIGEAHERPIREESAALKNFYETINRNRELQGEAPLKLIMATNSNDIYNPHLLTEGLVPVIERMKNTDKGVYIDNEKDLILLVPMHSPISERKRDTVLYRNGGKMAEMAIGNAFANNDFSEIGRQNLNEYKLLATCGKISIYGHKSRPSCYYIAQVVSGSTKQVYRSNESGLLRFRAHWKTRILKSRTMGLVKFSDAETLGLLTDYLHL